MQKSVSRSKTTVVGSPMDRALAQTRRCGWFVMVVKGTRLWVKKLFVATEYALLVTDLIKVWVEWREAAQLSHLHLEFNPQLSFKSSDTTLKLLDGKLDKASQHLFSLATYDSGDAELEFCFAISPIVSFRWTFRLQMLEVSKAAVFLKECMIEPFVSASNELSRQYEQMFKLFAAKDAEIAALAAKGQKADRSIRTERLTYTNLEEFVDYELHVAPTASCEVSPLFALFVAHATGANEQSRNPSARDEDLLNHLPGSPEASPQSQRPSTQQQNSQRGVGRGTQAPASYSQVPASVSPPGSNNASPKKAPQTKKAAVVIDGQPKKKQKVISRKNAFV